jgi:predicted nuclease with TOPRIM domain
MKEQLQQRLSELKAEYEAGQKMLADLERRQTNLQPTLLRISGAIQVLEEMLDAERQPADNGAAPPEEALAAEAETVEAEA